MKRIDHRAGACVIKSMYMHTNIICKSVLKCSYLIRTMQNPVLESRYELWLSKTLTYIAITNLKLDIITKNKITDVTGKLTVVEEDLKGR